ncbi:acyltransferase family protein [Mariniluteicoccus flavus]
MERAGGRERNVVIDAARVLSVAVVVVFHMALFRAGFGPDGALRASVAEPGVPGAVLSWFVQVMPLFFVTGGYAHAVVVDRGRERGEAYAHYLAARARRFIGPLTSFVAILGLLATAVAWAGWPKPAVFVSSSLTKVLWFLTVYLFIVTVAPLMVWLQDRAGAATLAGLLAGAAVVDAASFALAATDARAGLDLRHLNLVFVWLFCHQLEVVYHRGWWRTWSPVTCMLTTIAAIGAIVVLVGPGDYPYPAVGFGDRTVSNLLPPTAAMALLCLAQVGVLALVDRRRWPGLRTPRATRVLATLNALLMTIYLWHVPAVSIGMGVWLLVVRALPQLDSWWLSAVVQLAIGLPLLALWVPRVARIELRLIPPLGPRPSLADGLGAVALLLVGTGLVWRNGLAVHAASPYAALGVAVITIGSLLLRRACDAGRAGPQGADSGVMER